MKDMCDKPSTPRRIADDHVAQVAALDPRTATRLGLHPEDDRQPDLSPEGFEALAELARRTLCALDATEKDGMEFENAERNCARLLRERLTSELALYEAGDHFRELRNVSSPLHKVRRMFTLMPTDTEENWATVAGRLRNLPGALDGYRATLTEGIARDLLCAPRQARAVIGQLAAWTGQDVGGAGWFAEFVAGAPDRLRPELDAAAERATAAVAGCTAPICPPRKAPRTPSAANATCARPAGPTEPTWTRPRPTPGPGKSSTARPPRCGPRPAGSSRERPSGRPWTT